MAANIKASAIGGRPCLSGGRGLMSHAMRCRPLRFACASAFFCLPVSPDAIPGPVHGKRASLAFERSVR